MSARRKSLGFTLVEILIVVVILGILAAIVIPQFTQASIQAQQSSLETQIRTVRSQLELYQMQHNGNYPTDAQMVTTDFGNLLITTDAAGAAGSAFGPYLQNEPINPFEVASAVLADGSAAAGSGWTYNDSTGRFLAIMSAADEAKTTIDSNDVENY